MTISNSDNKSSFLDLAESEITISEVTASGGSFGPKWAVRISNPVSWRSDDGSGSRFRVQIASTREDESLTFEFQELGSIIKALSILNSFIAKVEGVEP